MLPLDPIYQRITGVEGLSGLICSNCKANEEAVAKCVECDNLLSSNCNTVIPIRYDLPVFDLHFIILVCYCLF